MFLIKELSENEIVLEISSELNGKEALAEFQENIEILSSGSHGIVTLDLLRVDAINSPGLSKILIFRKNLIEQKRKLQIHGCSDSLYKTFNLIKFDKIINITK